MKAPGGSGGPASMSNHSHTTSTKTDSFRRLELVTGVGRRRRWTDEEKAWIVAESLDPATTASAVARRYGLHARDGVVSDQTRRTPPSACSVSPVIQPLLMRKTTDRKSTR